MVQLLYPSRFMEYCLRGSQKDFEDPEVKEESCTHELTAALVAYSRTLQDYLSEHCSMGWEGAHKPAPLIWEAMDSWMPVEGESVSSRGVIPDRLTMILWIAAISMHIQEAIGEVFKKRGYEVWSMEGGRYWRISGEREDV